MIVVVPIGPEVRAAETHYECKSNKRFFAGSNMRLGGPRGMQPAASLQACDTVQWNRLHAKWLNSARSTLFFRTSRPCGITFIELPTASHTRWPEEKKKG